MSDLLMTGLNAYEPRAYKPVTKEEQTIKREAFTAGMEYASSLTADDYFAAFKKLRDDYEALRKELEACRDSAHGQPGVSVSIGQSSCFCPFGGAVQYHNPSCPNGTP